MFVVIVICFCVVLIISPLARCILKNFHMVGIYSIIDIINYVKYKKWSEWDLFGIDLYCGEFGTGKTLSMTHRARNIYNQFGDRVRFISNYDLKDIPYIPLINFNQLIDIGDEDDNKYEGTVVLIDEVQTLLSHRNFAKFPLELLNMLCQQRKRGVFILASCQRFFMVDRIFRSITTNVIICKKFWRFEHCKVYDAWDMENAVNNDMLNSKGNLWWFIKNQDYSCYDTSQMIKKTASEDFISNDELLVRKGLDMVVNDKAIKNSHLKKHKEKRRREKA